MDERRAFTFGDLVALTDTPRGLVEHWVAADVIVPMSGGGGRGRGFQRAFPYFSLVEVAICHRLHLLGVTTNAMRTIVASLRLSWHVRDDAETLVAVHYNRGDLGRMERRPPIARFDTPASLAKWIGLTGDTFGHVVDLADYLEELAERTGHPFAATEQEVSAVVQMAAADRPLLSPEGEALARALFAALTDDATTPTPDDKPAKAKR